MKWWWTSLVLRETQIKTTWEATSHPLGQLVWTKQKKETSVKWRCGESPCALVRVENGTVSMENTMALPQKVKKK